MPIASAIIGIINRAIKANILPPFPSVRDGRITIIRIRMIAAIKTGTIIDINDGKIIVGLQPNCQQKGIRSQVGPCNQW